MVYLDYCTRWSPRKRQKTCHMLADTVEELEEFARKIQLPIYWLQKHPIPYLTHFDLAASWRAIAIANGAVVFNSQYIVKRLKHQYEQTQNQEQ